MAFKDFRQAISLAFDSINSAFKVSIVSGGASSGKSSVVLARHDYSSGAVSTSAYTELVHALSNSVNELFIFDSSGQTLVLAVGAAGFEVDQLYITPGGNGAVDLAIASGARVSIKAVSANATVGEINVSFLK